MSPQDLALKFHEAYERLSLAYGYTTRPESRQFDPASPNGRLMIAVCGEILAHPPLPDAGEWARRLREAEHERDEAVNWTAIVDRHGTDCFDDLAEQWFAQVGIERMFNAIASVFAKWSNDELMGRFKKGMRAFAQQAFVEGCMVGVRAEIGRQAAAPQQEGVAGWRDIESAPKAAPGEPAIPVLISWTYRDREPGVGEAYWHPTNSEEGDWWWANTSPGDYFSGPVLDSITGQIIGWQPLPHPPSGESL